MKKLISLLFAGFFFIACNGGNPTGFSLEDTDSIPGFPEGNKCLIQEKLYRAPRVDTFYSWQWWPSCQVKEFGKCAKYQHIDSTRQAPEAYLVWAYINDLEYKPFKVDSTTYINAEIGTIVPGCLKWERYKW